MDTLHQIFNYLNNLPASDWTTLLSYLGGSTVVASILQVLKHKLNFAEAQKLIVVLLGVFSFLASFADFLIQSNPNLSALPWLGKTTALLMAGAVVVHRFAVSPAYYKLNLKLSNLGKLLKEVEGEQAAAKAPTLPSEANLQQFQV